MKNNFLLTIESPCTEDFNKFTSTSKGGFCNACSKEVIDFTKLSSKEIDDYFKNEKSENVCGRFKTDQITNHKQLALKKKNRLGFLSGLGLACISFFNSSILQAQEVKPENKLDNELKTEDTNQEYMTVKGVVTEGGLPLPGVSIVLRGATKGTQTDMDGNFVFPVKLKKGDVLDFSFIGMESKKVKIERANSASNIELQVSMKGSVLMGKVAKKGVYSSKK